MRINYYGTKLQQVTIFVTKNKHIFCYLKFVFRYLAYNHVQPNYI